MDIKFTTENIASLAVCGLLAVLIPIAAIVVYKIRNKDAWLLSALIGAGTFLVFALTLEQLLHLVMLPIVSGSSAAYVAYGALAAGVFEETGRFVAYKTLMKKRYTTKNSIMMGLGHGGFEAAFLLGMMSLSNVIVAVTVNAGGLDAMMASAAGNETAIAAMQTQLDAIGQFGWGSILLPICERIVAMTLHVCLSVWVYKAVSAKGKLWLYPAAILVHAAVDVPAALYQVGVIGIEVSEICMTVSVAITVPITVLIAKKLTVDSKQ